MPFFKIWEELNLTNLLPEKQLTLKVLMGEKLAAANQADHLVALMC